MTNEEMAARIQAGERELLPELWEQVRLLVLKKAHQRAEHGLNGAELEDLEQAGAVAMLRAVDTFDATAGTKFLTWLEFYLRQEFAEATGWKSKGTRHDAFHIAGRLDAPLTLAEYDSSTFGELLPDPAEAASIQAVEDRDWLESLRGTLAPMLAGLSERQQAAIYRRFWLRERRVDRSAMVTAMTQLRKPDRLRTLRGFL